MDIPFLNLKTQNSLLKKEILPLWKDILENASFIGGKYVEDFENLFAKICEVHHCAAVASGTDALRFIFMALGIVPGDEIITVPNTFAATVEAISQAGAKTVFVDIDPKTYNISPSQIEAAISPRTKGIVPVHLYGQPAEMDTINAIAEKYDLWVAEDACQAHLAEYKGDRAGSLGKAAAFSFYPGKNLGACGEAGAVASNDKDLIDKIKMIRDHGQSQKYYHNIEGYNGRCDALQAAALTVKLQYLPEWNQKRQIVADLYHRLLADADLILPAIRPDCLSSYHLFVVQVENRDSAADYLRGKGVQTGLHYPVPLHLQKAFACLQYTSGSFPVCEEVADKILSLPIYPEMSREQVHYVCDCLKGAISKD